MQSSNGGNASMASRWLTLDNFRTIDDSTQPKETWTIPGRAGDVARNGREARVSRVAPDISAGHDRDRVSVTLVFAHENGAGLEAPVRSQLVSPSEPIHSPQAAITRAPSSSDSGIPPP